METLWDPHLWFLRRLAGTFCTVPDPLVFPPFICDLWLQNGTAT